MLFLGPLFNTFLSVGAFLFIIYLGKLLPDVDVRLYVDGKWGPANLFHCGNIHLGLLAFNLGVSKEMAREGITYSKISFQGLVIASAAMAPILVHIFSSFLYFRGWKPLAIADCLVLRWRCSKGNSLSKSFIAPAIAIPANAWQ